MGGFVAIERRLNGLSFAQPLGRIRRKEPLLSLVYKARKFGERNCGRGDVLLLWSSIP